MIKTTISGRLDNQADLISALALDNTSLKTPQGTDDIIAGAWQKWGEHLPEHLLGDFALAVEDSSAGVTFLARDPLGVKPLYYRVDNGQLSWGFSVPELRKKCLLDVTPCYDWMAQYLLGLSTDNRLTAYKEVFRVAPGHCLTIDAHGHVQERRYHFWRDDAPSAVRRDPCWVEEYRSVLEEAIRCRMVDAPMGSENSGGIDSATITAYLAHFLGRPGDRLHSFGFAWCEQEPAYILETSQAKNIVHNYIITSQERGNPDPDDFIKQGLAAIGYPEERNNGTGHIPFYEECQRRGITTLFSGFGGDEVVTNPGHLLRYELLDKGEYRLLWDILPGDPIRRVLRLAKAMTLGRKSPAYRPAFLAAWNQRWPHQILKPEVVARLNLHHQYMETARYDAPYRRVNDFILNFLIDAPYVSARFESCTLMAKAYGIDYNWPLWDVRLVQQYLSTPSIEKVGPHGIGRYLHRRAIDQVVPKRVAWKPSKDMGYANFRSEQRAKGCAESAEIAKRHERYLHPALEPLIDRDKWKTQIDQVAAGNHIDDRFLFTFRRSLQAIRWLNLWLYEGELPE
ncbi:MAG: asparagine synthase-related protein [Methylobacter sp.]